MEKGNKSRNEKIYRKIMNLVCGNYKMEEADLDLFINRAIPQLPTKKRKKLDKFFGIDGGIDHFENIQKKLSKGKPLQTSEKEMQNEIDAILRRLGSIDYLVLFRNDTKELMRKIARKCDGWEENISKSKWAMIYAVIIYGGPYFFCDQIEVKKNTDLYRENMYFICMTMLMEQVYEYMFENMPDGELLLSVVKAWVDNLDVEDKLSILDYFGIKIPNYLREFEVKEIGSILDLRKLKEKIFFNGPWATSAHLFLKRGILSENLKEGFYELYELIKEGNKITRSEPEEYPFGTGIKQIQFYKIQGDKNPIEFPYIEEIMLTFREWDTICSPA